MKSLWISKYALTEGVKAEDWDGEVSPHGYATVKGYWCLFKMGKEAHETEAEAKQAAEKKRLAKIASLKKQLAKLEAMTFTGKKGGAK